MPDDIKPVKIEETKKGSEKFDHTVTFKTELLSEFTYIGPAAGANGKALGFPGLHPIVPTKMNDKAIAALENSHPDIFKKLWERKEVK